MVAGGFLVNRLQGGALLFQRHDTSDLDDSIRAVDVYVGMRPGVVFVPDFPQQPQVPSTGAAVFRTRAVFASGNQPSASTWYRFWEQADACRTTSVP